MRERHHDMTVCSCFAKVIITYIIMINSVIMIIPIMMMINFMIMLIIIMIMLIIITIVMTIMLMMMIREQVLKGCKLASPALTSKDGQPW